MRMLLPPAYVSTPFERVAHRFHVLVDVSAAGSHTNGSHAPDPHPDAPPRPRPHFTPSGGPAQRRQRAHSAAVVSSGVRGAFVGPHVGWMRPGSPSSLPLPPSSSPPHFLQHFISPPHPRGTLTSTSLSISCLPPPPALPLGRLTAGFASLLLCALWIAGVFALPLPKRAPMSQRACVCAPGA
jgi:hypothetical protein